MSTTNEGSRWMQPNGLSDLSAAVDEIYFLRALLADESGIIEAHLSLKTFPKSRRRFAEEQVERMGRVARGEMYTAARENFNQKLALKRLGADDCLTNQQWAEQRGLTPTNPPADHETAPEGGASGRGV